MDYKDIRSITFGVKFNHSFKLLDSWGAIADDMLYNSKYFSTDMFPGIVTNYTTQRYLYNAEKGHRFTLSADNLVFTQAIEENWKKDYQLFVDRIQKYIIPCILSKNSLISRRMGIVYLTTLTRSEIAKFAEKYFKPEITDICDFRFSRKEPTIAGSVFKETTDYYNKIFTVGNIDGKLGLSYDFQLHMVPANADIRDSIKLFIPSSETHFNKDVWHCFGGK